uniref:Clan SC, family S28, unassigned serine peptidase n=1 Tax=Strongyloides stercoralis TaxID=6248 RepID=A0A913I6J3_STRER
MLKFFVIFILVSGTLEIHKFPKYSEKLNQNSYKYETKTFTVPIDEFSESITDTFEMKYLINNTFHKKGGPIFFYTGNEGFIESFAENTGIMWDLAQTFNASVVFAEHRYYGQPKNRPFTVNSKSSINHLGYLTPNQALADYAKLIVDLKKNYYNDSNLKVIAFGGSYGGMLSFWFRIKYPHIVDGVWASSAPVIYFQGSTVDWGAFDKITTKTFAASGCNTDSIYKGWGALQKIANTTDGIDWINKNFNIDKKSYLKNPSDINYVIAYIQEAFEYMAMTDYGYKTNFLKLMPGLPVHAACQYLKKNFTNDKENAMGMYKAAMIYYNYNNPNGTNCVNPQICGDEGVASLGDPDYWNWQECTSLVITQCSRGPPNDMFLPGCGKGPVEILKNSCLSTFKSLNWTTEYLKPTEIPTTFGLTFNSISNAILTTGTYDPWYGGCLQSNMPGMKEAQTKRGFYVFEIEGAAHHADLRQPNTCDSPNLVKARFEITRIINCWVNPSDSKCSNFPFSVNNFGPFQPQDTNNCSYLYNKYPWGQKEQTNSVTHSYVISFVNVLLITLIAFIYNTF